MRADMVTYGKTLGGGLPVGVVCGAKKWMRRFREDHPADICFARGTFNSHPYVMGAMDAFLDHIDTDADTSIYSSLDRVWNKRASDLNARLRDARVAGAGSQSVLDLDGALHPILAVTTGCCSITCAPKDSPCAGSAPAA